MGDILNSTWGVAPEDTHCSVTACHAPIKKGDIYVDHHLGGVYGGCIDCGMKHGKVWNMVDAVNVPKAVKILSFGYKTGIPPLSTSGKMYDLRKTVRNPWRIEKYRKLTGLNPDVQNFVSKCTGAKIILNQIVNLAVPTGHTMISLGCHGGKHRSVAIAELAAKALKEKYPTLTVHIEHRDIQKKEN